jgi:hypothetical protein
MPQRVLKERGGKNLAAFTGAGTRKEISQCPRPSGEESGVRRRETVLILLMKEPEAQKLAISEMTPYAVSSV